MNQVSACASSVFTPIEEGLSPCCDRIYEIYLSALQILKNLLSACLPWAATRAIISLFAEPWQCIKTTILYPFGCSESIQYYNLNPETPNPSKRPILLIHGSAQNQSMWIPFARYVNNQEAELGSLYTINLPDGLVTDEDFALVFAKIDKIREKTVHPVDIVGFSRGGYVAQNLPERDSIGKRVVLGDSITKPFESLYEIRGKYDALVNYNIPRTVKEEHYYEHNCGHVELP